MRWDEKAPCRGHLDIFYVSGGTGRKQAEQLCASCPVKAECLADAVEYERGLRQLTVGYRAGMSANQRLKYAKALLAADKQPGRPRTPIEHGTQAGYKKHWKRGEAACEPCLSANRERLRALRARRKKEAA